MKTNMHTVLNREIEEWLGGKVDFIRFVDISALPHKTIATLSGSGWIGKNNLFVTADYGAAQCLGSVLTDAPLSVAKHETQPSRCGGCTVCADICPEKALKGHNWSRAVPRDEMINVYACDTCLKCLAHCPATRAYVRRALRE